MLVLAPHCTPHPPTGVAPTRTPVAFFPRLLALREWAKAASALDALTDRKCQPEAVPPRQARQLAALQQRADTLGALRKQVRWGMMPEARHRSSARLLP